MFNKREAMNVLNLLSNLDDTTSNNSTNISAKIVKVSEKSTVTLSTIIICTWDVCVRPLRQERVSFTSVNVK